MRIAFVVPAPFDLLTGGAIYNRRIVAGLRERGHTVAVHEIAGQHPLADAAARISAQAIWAALPEAAIVVIDNLGLAAFSDLAEALPSRAVVVLDHHPTGLETGLSPDAQSALLDVEKRLVPLARRVIATSTTTAATLVADFAVRPERLSVIEPGTEPAPRSQGSGVATLNVLSIGSLIARKGHDVLLRAMARLCDLEWRLTIAGSARHDPATAAALADLAQQLGIADRVTFLGEMTGAPLAALWRSADLFALATRYEGYGMAIAEALRRGLPVAVGGGGAAGALVTPQTGVVCPPGDVDQLSKALRRLIFDTALRHTMADAAWEWGARLPDWPGQSALFAQALESAVL